MPDTKSVTSAGQMMAYPHSTPSTGCKEFFCGWRNYLPTQKAAAEAARRVVLPAGGASLEKDSWFISAFAVSSKGLEK